MRRLLGSEGPIEGDAENSCPLAKGLHYPRYNQDFQEVIAEKATC